MIVVMPNAYSKYGGSMYSSSVTTGDWEMYIAEDLVAYMDSHYRTIPERGSRGLAGHSMGGYGAVRIGMKRPDVFSSLYIMSACCLINNPFPAPPANSNQNIQKALAGALQIDRRVVGCVFPQSEESTALFRRADEATANRSRW